MKCEQELALLREAIRNERKDKRITQEELQKCWRFLQLI